MREASTVELTRRLDFWRDVELTRCILGTTKISAPAAAPVKRFALPDDDCSPLDELPPWDGTGEDILADTEMGDDAVDTDEDGDDIDDDVTGILVGSTAVYAGMFRCRAATSRRRREWLDSLANQHGTRPETFHVVAVLHGVQFVS